MMKNTDDRMESGPVGGDAVETIVAAGTPEDIVASEQSITEKISENRKRIKIT